MPMAHYPVPCRTRKIRTTTGYAHYPGGAMGTSRPTAITHAKFARHYTPRITQAMVDCRASRLAPYVMPHAGCARPTGHAHYPWRHATPGGAVAFRLSGGSVANGGYKPLKCQPKSL